MRRPPAADFRRDRRIHQGGRRRRFLPAVLGLEARRLMTVGVPPMVADPGFEAFSVGGGVAAYGKPNTPQPWVYTGPAGVTANATHFTQLNPGAPQGGQSAYLMGSGTISQAVPGWEAGAYTISFKAAQRGNFAGVQTIQVKVDGNVVGTFTPSGTDYQKYATAAFVLPTGPQAHTVSFAGPASGEATVFLDEVAIEAAVPVVGDSGFESPAMAAGVFARPASGSPWSFSPYGSGITANDSPFTGPDLDAPQGGQVAYLQSEIASISQTIPGWRAGSYTIAFRAAQRSGNAQTIQVKVDGEVVATVKPAGSTYTSFAAPITVAAGSHTITFAGTAAGDQSAFLDDVLVFATPPKPAPIGDASFETASAAGGIAARPPASDWSYAATSGISANGTPFTSGNPPAPSGGQVAYIQDAAAISRTIPGLQAGAYRLTFKAARRGNFGVAQTIQVRVDGELVGSFTPKGAAYEDFAADFAVAAGARTIAFVGTAAGDGTAFLDDVALAPAAPVPMDSGFERVVASPTSKFRQNPEGSPWTFYGVSGLSANGSAYTIDNPPAPQGSQVAYLMGRGTISQATAGWQAGTYAISFKAAQRSFQGVNSQVIQVMVDGDVVGAFTPSGTGYREFVTNAFEVIDGRQTISFAGLDSTNQQTAFIDDVRLIPAAGRQDAPGGASIVLNATIRDFKAAHPDFQVDADTIVDRGLVAATLGPDGLPVFVAANGAGSITDAATFRQWFRTTAGVNGEASLPLSLTETSPGSGVYEFSDASFYPIDGRLLGDEGGSLRDQVGLPHNSLFTMHVGADFVYRGGESYSFRSDDDLWVFIDGRLALDLGGLHPGATGRISLDGLGLAGGGTYRMDVFYAERRSGGAVFRMQTGAAT